MRKLVVSESMTLDGVFDAYTMGQWVTPFDSEERNKFIQDTILAADAFLFGRTTYEMYTQYWSGMKNNEYGIADRLNSAHKYVVSANIAKADWNNSTIIKANVAEEVARLKQKAGEHILIIGSAILVQSLMQSDLIDEYKFLVHPAIIGSGKRFFRDGMVTSKLKLAESKALSSGVVALSYTRTT